MNVKDEELLKFISNEDLSDDEMLCIAVIHHRLVRRRTIIRFYNTLFVCIIGFAIIKHTGLMG